MFKEFNKLLRCSIKTIETKASGRSYYPKSMEK